VLSFFLRVRMVDVIFPFVGGVGLFLVGMTLLSEGLVAFAGGSLQRVLATFTGTPVKAFASGVVLTALAQSSTATTVTLIGFVSAGLITFIQAIGVVIGASLGNTATGWIVAGLGLKVNLSFYTLPLIGLGALLKLLAKGQATQLGKALSGFGMLFLGLGMLQDGMQGLAESFSLAHLPAGGYGAHAIILLAGLALTAMLQSSTAAIAMTLTALDAGTINFDQAAAVVIGAAIGTTLTGALVAIGGTVYAKRTALAYILFNVASGLIALLLLPLFLQAIHALGSTLGLTPGALGLAAFHSLFILVGAAVFLPLIRPFATLVQRLIPDRTSRREHHLDASMLGVPAVALEASQRTLEEMADRIFSVFQQLLGSAPPVSAGETLRQTHAVLDDAYEFVARILTQREDEHMNAQRSAQLHAIDHLIRLCNRLRGMLNDKVDFGLADRQLAVASITSMLATSREGLRNGLDEHTVGRLTSEADSLVSLLRQTRHELLNETAVSRDTPHALRTIDIYRGIERTGNHIWRACHYLALGRQHATEDTMSLQALAPDST